MKQQTQRLSDLSPSVAKHVRLHWDSVRRVAVLLDPERATFVSKSAYEIVTLCDGTTSTQTIVEKLLVRFPNAPIEVDVHKTLRHLHHRGLITFDQNLSDTARTEDTTSVKESSTDPGLQPPLALTAELTYRCPLRCGYCSNPVDLRSFSESMSLERWRGAIESCADAGVLQCSFSGGEPLLFDGLVELVRTARARGMYCNLITSGWGLDRAKLDLLAAAGLEHVQISLQHSDAVKADPIAGASGAHQRKLNAMRAVVDAGLALSVNVVIHRDSVSSVGPLLNLARDVGALRIELASVQAHGWALLNRDALLPSRQQCAEVTEVVRLFRASHEGLLRVIYVVPDYYADRPKPCMDGWGRKFLTITPDGTLLPCPGSHALPLPFEKFDDRDSISQHWEHSPVFQAFRGEQWMLEPCRSCDERGKDYGGCRCQAFALAANMAAADPTCSKSQHHSVVVAARTKAQSSEPPLVQLRTLSTKSKEAS